MAQDLYVSPDSQTSIKSSIESNFNIACSAASEVQMAILTKAPGNIIPTYRAFRKHWNVIFLMVGDKKELEAAIVKETRKYLDSVFNYGDKEMLNGIKLFEKFKGELFKKNLLVRG
jgi:hypothetical protein